MRLPLEITFGRSPSAHYGQAVQRARAFSGYRQAGEGPTLVHTVVAKESLAHEATWEKLPYLLRLIQSWKSTRLTVAGHVMNYWQLTSRLAQVKSCHARKVQQNAGPGYCSGKQRPVDEATSFGCRLLRCITRQIHGRDSWIH